MAARFRLAALSTAAVALLAAGVSALPASSVNDTATAGFVEDALQHDPRITGDVEVSVEAGIVRLVGPTHTLAAKEYAEAQARKVRGMRGVINEIVVDPRLLSDRDVAAIVRRRLASSATLSGQNVTVASDEGVVTLGGWVSSSSEADESNLLARETHGVQAVRNEIEVRRRSERTDREVRNDVLETFKRDVYLSGLPIRVSVEHDAVTLTGTVANAYEKARAEQRARVVANVERVDDQLAVDSSQDRGVYSGASRLSDDEIRQAVVDELRLDERLEHAPIRVTVDEGNVTLAGTLPSAQAKLVAEQDAMSVIGVAWVSDELRVEGASRQDWLVKSEIDYILHSDSLLHDAAIVTEVNDGVVNLFGEVAAPLEKLHATESARRVHGVKGIVNHVTVKLDATLTDARLADAIENRLTLNWRTWLVRNRIGVNVTEGIATLDGNVDTFAERAEAAGAALHEQGIWRVHNQITVNDYPCPWNEWIDRSPDEARAPHFDPLYEDLR